MNSIAPGAIRTELNREAWNTPEAEAQLLKLVLYGRIGEVEEVAWGRDVARLRRNRLHYRYNTITGTTL